MYQCASLRATERERKQRGGNQRSEREKNANLSFPTGGKLPPHFARRTRKTHTFYSTSLPLSFFIPLSFSCRSLDREHTADRTRDKSILCSWAFDGPYSTLQKSLTLFNTLANTMKHRWSRTRQEKTSPFYKRHFSNYYFSHFSSQATLL